MGGFDEREGETARTVGGFDERGQGETVRTVGDFDEGGKVRQHALWVILMKGAR